MVLLGVPNWEDFLAFLVFLERRKQNFRTKNIPVLSALSLATPHHLCLRIASPQWNVSRLLFEDIYKQVELHYFLPPPPPQ